MLRPGTFALTALLAALTAIGPLTTDMYLPSLPDIARQLGRMLDRILDRDGGLLGQLQFLPREGQRHPVGKIALARIGRKPPHLDRRRA